MVTEDNEMKVAHELFEACKRARFLITRIQDEYYEAFNNRQDSTIPWKTIGFEELEILNAVIAKVEGK